MVEIALKICQGVSEVLDLVSFDNDSCHRVEPLMHAVPVIADFWRSVGFVHERETRSVAVSLIKINDFRMVHTICVTLRIVNKVPLIVTDKVVAGRHLWFLHKLLRLVFGFAIVIVAR
jgi:hypothetical protein